MNERRKAKTFFFYFARHATFFGIVSAKPMCCTTRNKKTRIKTAFILSVYIQCNALYNTVVHKHMYSYIDSR